MAYVDIPGAWIETAPKTGPWFNAGPAINTTTLVIDAVNESIQIIGPCWISGRATNVTMDTNSKIHVRSGTGNVFAHASGSVLTFGVQDVDAATGPPGRGDGVYDVSGTHAVAWADSTTYSIQMTSGSKVISHQQRICIKCELTTFTASDSVRFQGAAINSSGGPGNVVLSTLNNALSALAPTLLIIDFEGDSSVLGYINCGIPAFESIPATITYNNTVEYGMAFRPLVSQKLDAFWLLGGLTDAVNGDLIFCTDPYGTPGAGTTLLALDGDTTAANNAIRAMDAGGDAVEVVGGSDYVFALRSNGTNARVAPVQVRHVNDILHFYGFSTNDIMVTRTGTSSAFSPVSSNIMLWGAHQCAIHDGSGGAGGGAGIYARRALDGVTA